MGITITRFTEPPRQAFTLLDVRPERIARGAPAG